MSVKYSVPQIVLSDKKVRGCRHAEYNTLLPFYRARGSREGNNINQNAANFLVLRAEDIRTYQHS